MEDLNMTTPPRKLVQQWLTEFYGATMAPGEATMDLAARAAQWGADQELKASCEWLDREGWSGESRQLRAARRPKPPSLKQQALDELTAWTEVRNGPGESLLCDGLSVATIRRALEQLPDD